MADKTIRNNSPDETQYHEGVAGMPGTMIPRAGHEGSSRGIHHDVAGQVVVDPGEPGGGFTLDMGALSGTKENFNSAAVRNDVLEDPQAFYRGLAKAQKEPKPPIKKETKMRTDPSGHPMENATSTPEPLQPLQPLPPVSSVAGMTDHTSALEKMLQEEKAKAEAVALAGQGNFDYKMAAAESTKVAPLYYAAGPATPPPRVHRDTAVADSYMLQQLVAGMAQQRETINALVAIQTEKAAVVEDIVEAEVEEAPEKALMYLHNVPFLEGDKPQRPNYEIYFEMPKMGTMAARYHAVVEGNDCLALIYDTRFEDGFQYLPPSLGEEQISVSVPKLSKTPYTCSSLGLHWTLGCMDVVILIKHSDGE